MRYEPDTDRVDRKDTYYLNRYYIYILFLFFLYYINVYNETDRLLVAGYTFLLEH